MPVHPTGTGIECQAPITGRKSINSDAAFAGMSMARMARILEGRHCAAVSAFDKRVTINGHLEVKAGANALNMLSSATVH
jgi:hypothetical protein